MRGWAGGLAGGWPKAIWCQSGDANLANLAVSPVWSAKSCVFYFVDYDADDG